MIVRHYLELLRYYRRLVALIVGGVTLTALALCLVFMTVSPIYTASAKIVMLPTEAELAFTRGWLGSSTFDPASIMVQTQEQYLLSRTVAERALDKLMVDFPAAAPPSGLEGRLHAAFQTALRTLWQVYATLNYGTYIAVSEREQLLNDLQDAIAFEWIEGSFVMLLSANYDSPEGAARIANAVADAYVEVKQAEISRAATEILAELAGQQEEKLGQLETLRQREAAINQSLGVQDRAATRASVLDAIAEQAQEIRADELELARLTARTAQLAEDERRLRSLGLAGSIEQDIALADADRAALETALRTRRQSAQELEQRLVALTSADQELAAIADRKTEVQAALADLNDRQTVIELAQSAAVDQVRIIDPARAPVYPWFPKTLNITLAAFAGSILLALFVMVALDTFSGTVKTSADLRRLFGERSLDRIPRRFCRRLARTTSSTSAGAWLRRNAVVDGLATRLRLLGAVFPSSIMVLGLHSEHAVGCAAKAVAVGCAASGLNVHLQDPEAETAANEPADQERPLPTVLPAGYDCGRDIAVRQVGLVGRSLDWFQVTQELNVLVCAVAPGETSETLLTKLDAEAAARGVPLVLFILCDA